MACMADFILDPSLTRIQLTDEQIGHLRSEVDRSSIDATALLRRLKDVPDGLSSQMISSWLNNRNSARLDHYQYIVNAWATMPDGLSRIEVSKPPRIRLTENRVLALRSLMKEKETPLSFLFKNKNNKFPDGLTYATVRGWLNGVRTADEGHFAFVLEYYQSLPLAELKEEILPSSRMNGAVLEVSIAHDTLLQLRRLQSESGLNPRQLFEEQDDIPNDLDYLQVHEWMARRRVWAAEVHLSYVLRVWSKATSLNETGR